MKPCKEQSTEDKEADAQKAKDDEIAQLRQRIKLAEVTQQADEVLKESGLALGKDMLSLLVNEDEEQTYSNVKSLISFLDTQQKQWEVKRNTGTTPKRLKNTGLTQEQFEKMGYSERVQLKLSNPETYTKLIKGE